jgi:hypothetical protein
LFWGAAAGQVPPHGAAEAAAEARRTEEATGSGEEEAAFDPFEDAPSWGAAAHGSLERPAPGRELAPRVLRLGTGGALLASRAAAAALLPGGGGPEALEALLAPMGPSELRAAVQACGHPLAALALLAEGARKGSEGRGGGADWLLATRSTERSGIPPKSGLAIDKVILTRPRSCMRFRRQRPLHRFRGGRGG